METQSQPEQPKDELVEDDADDKPLTSEEIRERVVGLSAEAKDAAAALYEDAKDVWLIPVRKGIRSRFNRARRFFSDLGGD